MSPRALPLWRELAPSPARWNGALQITALCMATVAIAMMFGVPEAALSCYLIFFAWKDDTGSAVVTGLVLIIAASVALPLVQPLMRLAVDSAPWRLGLMCTFTLVGMTLAHASRAAPMIGTASFVLAFAVTLYDVVPVPSLLSRAMAWMWVVVFVPMALMAIVGILFGTSPRHQVERLIAARQRAIHHPHRAAAQALLDEGGENMDRWLGRLRLTGHARGAQADALAAAAEASYLALARAEADLPQRHGPPAPAHPADKAPLFQPDLLSNPAHLRFGIKVMIAVILTYGIYTLGGAFEIHTAMITCYFVALGTEAETRHKITLRLVGAILGGALGALVVFVLMPRLDDLGHLMLLVALGGFPAAWISLGSERITYAGWQMALCYFLVILGGTGPVTDPSAAIYRILGVAIGIVIVWGVFTLLWPVSADDRVETLLQDFDAKLAETAGRTLSGRAAMRLNAILADAARLDHYAVFEGRQNAGHAAQIAEARARLHRKLRHAKGDPHA